MLKRCNKFELKLFSSFPCVSLLLLLCIFKWNKKKSNAKHNLSLGKMKTNSQEHTHAYEKSHGKLEAILYSICIQMVRIFFFYLSFDFDSYQRHSWKWNNLKTWMKREGTHTKKKHDRKLNDESSRSRFHMKFNLGFSVIGLKAFPNTNTKKYTMNITGYQSSGVRLWI